MKTSVFHVIVVLSPVTRVLLIRPINLRPALLNAPPASNVWINALLKAITFAYQQGVALAQLFDPSRREFLASLGIAAIGAAFLRFTPVFHNKKSQLIRPPGSSEERASQPVYPLRRVCEGLPDRTTATQFLAGRGSDNLWTPVATMRTGYCDYLLQCLRAGLPYRGNPEIVAGKETESGNGEGCVLIRTDVFPGLKDRECIVCEEMCPIPTQGDSIRAEEEGDRGTQSNRSPSPGAGRFMYRLWDL